MANNRMYIVCQGCKKYLCLDKYYPECPWLITPEKLVELNKFWEDHHHECAEKIKARIGGDEITKIVYDNDELLSKIFEKKYN